MTVKEDKSKKIPSNEPMSIGQILFCFMSVVVLALTFFQSETAISAMSTGLKLCVNTVIPSLFPFMVLSELFIFSGAAQLSGKLLGKPLSWLFGISTTGAIALLLGFICGFPIGTKCALLLYEQGNISKKELEHLTVFCNNPSSAFLISAVGVSLFGSREFGLVLYISHLLSATIVGIISGIYYRKHPKMQVKSTTSSKKGFVLSVVDAVTSSASSMLFICAFVVFFSVVSGYLQALCDRTSLPALFRVIIIGFFEMTGGVSAASVLPASLAAPISALVCGWSGLSVHFQFIGICRNHKLSLKPYFLGKLACAGLNFVLISIFLATWGNRLNLSASGAFLPLTSAVTPTGAAIITLFFVSCGMLYKKTKSKI